MHRLTFTQPTLDIPSENAQRRAARSPQGRGAAIAISNALAEWKQAAWTAWKEQRFGDVGAVLGQPCEVRVILPFPIKRTRDPHNYVGTVVKSIIDGLVLAHVWPDDNPQYVTVLEPVLAIIKNGNPPLPVIVEFYIRGEGSNGDSHEEAAARNA